MLGLAPQASAPLAALRARPAFDHSLRAEGSIAVAGTAHGHSAATGRGGGRMSFAPAFGGHADITAGIGRTIPLLGSATVTAAARSDAAGDINWQGISAGTSHPEGRARDVFGFTGAAQAKTASRAELSVGLLGSGALPVSCSGAGNVASDATASGISALHVGLGGALAIRSNARGSLALLLATHAATGISSHAVHQAPPVLGASRAAADVTTAVHAAIWPMAGAAVGYRAPPALRRHEPPDQPQGGNLAPSLRAGRILKG